MQKRGPVYSHRIIMCIILFCLMGGEVSQQSEEWCGRQMDEKADHLPGVVLLSCCHWLGICHSTGETPVLLYTTVYTRVPDQNGISRLYNMLEIHHSGWNPQYVL